MLRIGDFARLSQTTVKALRFYDEIGLLKPTSVDRTTGYRYYAPHLLTRLNRILALKELGFSLAEVAALVQTDLSDEQVRHSLVRKRAELSQRITREQAQLAQVDAWLQQLRGSAGAGSGAAADPLVVLKQTPVQLVASVRAVLASYDEAEELFNELQHHLRRHQRSGQRAAIWHACAHSGAQIDCEVLIWLNQRVPEKGRVRVYELPASTAASVIHQGEDETIEQSYRVARRWIKAQGYTLAGPNREVYWPEAHAQASLTEIQYPVLIASRTNSTGN
jgi:DNA-binding transcriptional MerR regulator